MNGKEIVGGTGGHAAWFPKISSCNPSRLGLFYTQNSYLCDTSRKIDKAPKTPLMHDEKLAQTQQGPLHLRSVIYSQSTWVASPRFCSAELYDVPGREG